MSTDISILLSKLRQDCTRSRCDNTILHAIKTQLVPNQVLVDTTWITVDYVKSLNLNQTSTAICYSGIDWENTTCIDERLHAHQYIKENSGHQLHIGNADGPYYFNWCVEFIRQHPEYFFDDRYTIPPDCEYLYMCLNRKPHAHRIYLLDLLENQNLVKFGIVSKPGELSQFSETLICPIEVDDPESSNEKVNDIQSLGDTALWNKHFINVVTETTIHTNVMLSEKTWKPIVGLRPFLILGDYNIYKKLHKLGFDTFDDLFGLWYQDSNWENRADSIANILLNFEKDTSALNRLWLKIKPRLLLNRQRFVDFQLENLHKIQNLNLS